jgi:hypothetical protein
MPSDFIMDGYEYKPMIWLGLGSTGLIYYLQGDQNITSLIQIFETIIADQAGVLPVVVGNIWRKLMILFC